ncbi:hypothetical protein FB451DRAFT_1187368 [Mycena latifolia]|nr:hypothetical protein FB451DRAFT_1187368 [Mycena latifolia]
MSSPKRIKFNHFSREVKYTHKPMLATGLHESAPDMREADTHKSLVLFSPYPSVQRPLQEGLVQTIFKTGSRVGKAIVYHKSETNNRSPIPDRRIYSSRQLKAAISLLSDARERDNLAQGSEPTGADPVHNPESLILEDWTQRSSDLPAIMSVRISLPASIIRANENFFQCANRMLYWQTTYQKEREKCSAANNRIVKNIPHYYRGLKTKSLRRSPTLIRILDIYNKDLDTFTFHAFAGISSTVYSEIRHVAPAIPVLNPQTEIECRFCIPAKPQCTYRTQSLLQHIFKIHPEEFPQARRELQLPPSDSFCPACPLSVRIYGVEGLAMHYAAKSVPDYSL